MKRLGERQGLKLSLVREQKPKNEDMRSCPAIVVRDGKPVIVPGVMGIWEE